MRQVITTVGKIIQSYHGKKTSRPTYSQKNLRHLDFNFLSQRRFSSHLGIIQKQVTKWSSNKIIRQRRQRKYRFKTIRINMVTAKLKF